MADSSAMCINASLGLCVWFMNVTTIWQVPESVNKQIFQGPTKRCVYAFLFKLFLMFHFPQRTAEHFRLENCCKMYCPDDHRQISVAKICVRENHTVLPKIGLEPLDYVFRSLNNLDFKFHWVFDDYLLRFVNCLFC